MPISISASSASLPSKCRYSAGPLTPTAAPRSAMLTPWKPCLAKSSAATARICARLPVACRTVGVAICTECSGSLSAATVVRRYAGRMTLAPRWLRARAGVRVASALSAAAVGRAGAGGGRCRADPAGGEVAVQIGRDRRGTERAGDRHADARQLRQAGQRQLHGEGERRRGARHADGPGRSRAGADPRRLLRRPGRQRLGRAGRLRQRLARPDERPHAQLAARPPWCPSAFVPDKGGTMHAVLVAVGGTTTTSDPMHFVVLYAAPLAAVDAAQDTVMFYLMFGVPILIVVAGAATYVFAGRALRPVEAIRARVASMSEKDLAERVPVPAARDEVGRLAETMNGMIARLEQAQKRAAAVRRRRQPRAAQPARHHRRGPGAAAGQRPEHRAARCAARPSASGGWWTISCCSPAPTSAACSRGTTRWTSTRSWRPSAPGRTRTGCAPRCEPSTSGWSATAASSCGCCATWSTTRTGTPGPGCSSRSGATAIRRRSTSPTTGPACPPPTGSGSSSASCASTTPAPAPTAAPAWGWRSSPRWWRRTTGRCGSTTRPAAARCSACGCPRPSFRSTRTSSPPTSRATTSPSPNRPPRRRTRTAPAAGAANGHPGPRRPARTEHRRRRLHRAAAVGDTCTRTASRRLPRPTGAGRARPCPTATRPRAAVPNGTASPGRRAQRHREPPCARRRTAPHHPSPRPNGAIARSKRPGQRRRSGRRPHRTAPPPRHRFDPDAPAGGRS